MARSGKVTVVGAGFYGSTTALRLAEYDIFETVVLTDVVEGKAEGLALDMNQSRWVEGFETTIVGQTTGPSGEGYEAIGAKDVTAICLLAAPEGLARMEENYGNRDVDVTVVTAGLDEKLNEKGYIVPGLGDAGDRLYGVV